MVFIFCTFIILYFFAWRENFSFPFYHTKYSDYVLKKPTKNFQRKSPSFIITGITFCLKNQQRNISIFKKYLIYHDIYNYWHKSENIIEVCIF